MICPAETPEGQPCGVVKTLGLMAYVSVGCAPQPIIEFLSDWATEDLGEISASVIPTVRHVAVLAVLVATLHA